MSAAGQASPSIWTSAIQAVEGAGKVGMGVATGDPLTAVTGVAQETGASTSTGAGIASALPSITISRITTIVLGVIVFAAGIFLLGRGVLTK